MTFLDHTSSVLRSLTLIIGVSAMMIGSVAHFKSEFKIKENRETCKTDAILIGKSCPTLSMEQYFVAITIIGVAFSFGMIMVLLTRKEPIVDKVDAVSHLVMGLLILIGGIVMIVSANKIWSFVKEVSEVKLEPPAPKNYGQDYDKKIIAGVLAIINAICYIIVGLLTGLAVRKEIRADKKRSAYKPSPYTIGTPSAPHVSHLN